jgi:hypothetical protein
MDRPDKPGDDELYVDVSDRSESQSRFYPKNYFGPRNAAAISGWRGGL